MLKRIVKGIAVFFVMFAAAGCSFSRDAAYYGIEGYDRAANAKTLYAQLDSGHFYMQDNATGKITEEFTFLYRSDGNLMYSYMGDDGETVYYEFHNGSEIDYRYGEDPEWSYIEQGSDGYYVYSKSNRHHLTTESLISVNAYAVTDSEVEEYNDGLKLTFHYNASRLADTLSDIGELDSFESILWLNGDGYCYRLDQLAVFDGGEQVSDYSMYIDSMNEITELTRPEI